MMMQKAARAWVRLWSEQALRQHGPQQASKGWCCFREWPRRIDWLYTKAELPGLVDGWILPDEFHQAHPSRPVLYGVPPYAKHRSHERGTVLTTPVSAWRVAEVLLRLSRREDMHASELMSWAA